MNWKKWLKFDPYKKLWSLLGKRPWTFFIRDLWVQAEYIFIIAFTTIGFFTGMFWEEIRAWAMAHPILSFVILLAYGSLWFILGHIFWGTKHVPGQTGTNGTVVQPYKTNFAWRKKKEK